MSKFPKTAIALVTALMAFSQPAEALTLGQVAQVAESAQPAAFNSIELIAYNSEDKVPQWQHVKHALNKDVVKLQNCLDDASLCEGTAMTGWRSMVLGLQGQDAHAKLNLVNAFFNRWQYRSDEDAYGVADYWATPIEFMKNSGDCEDYAIAKYVTLKFLGFKDEQLRITAVLDNNRGGIGHAVLNVSTDEGSMVLDNLSDLVYNASQQTGYVPRFAVNETGVYTYAQQPQVIMASAEYVQQ